MCLVFHIIIQIISYWNVLTFRSNCLGKAPEYIFYSLKDVSGRIHVLEECNDVGAVVRGDQFPKNQGDAPVVERW